MTETVAVSFYIITMANGEFFATVEAEKQELLRFGPFSSFAEASRCSDELKKIGQKLADKYWQSERSFW